MQSENRNALPPIVFYGFKRDVPFNDYKLYLNFTLTKQENELIADCRAVACKEVDSFAPENRALSLSVPVDELKDINIYEMGMAKAQNLGLKVRDCSLCGRYKIPTWQNNRIDSRSCRLINVTWSFKDNTGREQRIKNPYVCWMPYRCNGFDKSKQAAGCRTYSLDRQRISRLVRSLEKMHKLVWIDESLLPYKQPIVNSMPIKNPKQIIQEEQTPPAVNPIVYEPVRKLLTLQECFSCPIYRPECGHRLGAEEKDGHRFVVCDYQRPKF